MESERHEEKYRAVIDGGCPGDEPVGQRWGKVEPALWRRRRSHSPTAPRCLRTARYGRTRRDLRRTDSVSGWHRSKRTYKRERNGERSMSVSTNCSHSSFRGHFHGLYPQLFLQSLLGEIGFGAGYFVLQRGGQLVDVGGCDVDRRGVEERSSAASNGVAAHLDQQSLHDVGIKLLGRE